MSRDTSAEHYVFPGAAINAAPRPARVSPFRIANSAERKQYPIYEGLFAYFPDALADVAHISYLGNEKHNPGEPLHWARNKSADHLDCVARHLLQAQWQFNGTDETELHMAEEIWRSLAAYQLFLEQKYKLTPPKNAVSE